jgi:hypothetical protein
MHHRKEREKHKSNIFPSDFKVLQKTQSLPTLSMFLTVPRSFDQYKGC